jgi:hypothetical protein
MLSTTFEPGASAQTDAQGTTDKADEDADRRAIERFRRLKPAQMERETVYLPGAELAFWLEPEEGTGLPDARKEPG